MPKKIMLALLLIVAALPVSLRAETGPEKIVHLGSFSNAVDYAPYLVAKSKGWFDQALAAQGYKADYVVFQSLPPINEAFATDRIDGVFDAETPAIIGRAAGIDVKIVGISSTVHLGILVPVDSPVQSVGDLKGKTIAVLAGTSMHRGLLGILANAGLASSDTQVLDMAPPDAKNAFETGKVNAWAIWPPYVEQEELAGKGRVIAAGEASIQSILTINDKWAKTHREQVATVLDVLKTAKQWVVSNPDEAQAIVARELNVPSEVIRKAWSLHDYSVALDPL